MDSRSVTFQVEVGGGRRLELPDKPSIRVCTFISPKVHFVGVGKANMGSGISKETEEKIEQIRRNEGDSLGTNVWFGQENLRDAGTRLLSEALIHNKTIKTISLWNNGVGSEGAKALAEALKHNGTLEKIFLARNMIGIEGAKRLSEALPLNYALQSLDIRGNCIGKEGAIALSEALKRNKALRVLIIPDNKIGNEGAKALSEALKHNNTLQEMIMDNNNIGDGGAMALRQTLKQNSTLQKIYLGGNKIGVDSVLALIDTLRDWNGTLTQLYLVGNPGWNEHPIDAEIHQLEKRNSEGKGPAANRRATG